LFWLITPIQPDYCFLKLIAIFTSSETRLSRFNYWIVRNLFVLLFSLFPRIRKNIIWKPNSIIETVKRRVTLSILILLLITIIIFPQKIKILFLLLFVHLFLLLLLVQLLLLVLLLLLVQLLRINLLLAYLLSIHLLLSDIFFILLYQLCFEIFVT